MRYHLFGYSNEGGYHMKRKIEIFLMVILIMLLPGCGSNVEETVSKTEHEAVLSELDAAKNELDRLREELTAMSEELENVKAVLEKTEEGNTLEYEIQEDLEKTEEGLTIATEPITVPDPETQSKFVVEVTKENFLSVFEFVAVDHYDAWGEYTSKVGTFSSLLYEQGWALGSVTDYRVQYIVYENMKGVDTFIGEIPMAWFVEKENVTPNPRIYDAKGTLIFYPIEDVHDEVTIIDDNIRRVYRTLSDGSAFLMYTYGDGTISF